MKTINQSHRSQFIYITLAIIILLPLSFGGYYLHAKNECNKVIGKRTNQVKGGIVLVQLELDDGTPANFVERDIFLTMCMAERFHL